MLDGTDLATATGATFHLLDLVPRPDPQDPDLELPGLDDPHDRGSAPCSTM